MDINNNKFNRLCLPNFKYYDGLRILLISIINFRVVQDKYILEKNLYNDVGLFYSVNNKDLLCSYSDAFVCGFINITIYHRSPFTILVSLISCKKKVIHHKP